MMSLGLLHGTVTTRPGRNVDVFKSSDLKNAPGLCFCSKKLPVLTARP